MRGISTVGSQDKRAWLLLDGVTEGGVASIARIPFDLHVNHLSLGIFFSKRDSFVSYGLGVANQKDESKSTLRDL